MLDIDKTLKEEAARYFRALACGDRETERLLRQAYERLPFLHKGYDDPAPFNGLGTEGCFANTAKQFGRWLNGLEKFCDNADPQDACKLLELLYRTYPGVQGEVREIAEKRGILLPELEEEKVRRQLMLFVTGTCNLNCPYCFSKEMEVKNLSRDNLKRIFDWCARESVETLTLCGGEPLMYPHLNELLETASRKGMDVYFATNFTVPLAEVVNVEFLGTVISSLTIHLTDALWRSPKAMETFARNVEICRGRNIELIARANFDRLDTDWRRWLEFMRDLGLDNLNVAVTIPSTGRSNHWNDPSSFRDYFPILADLMGECRKRGITLGIAKPFPICYFPDYIAEFMAADDPLQPLCMIHLDNYLRDMCVYPDMHMAPCLSLSEPTVQFRDEMTWKDLEEIFAPRVRELLDSPLFERCSDCFLYLRKLCQGSCLGYKRKE